MRSDWPGGADVAVSLTFDVDAESGWLDFEGRLSTLSEARYGVTRGVPRILGILDRAGVRGTFYIPGWTPSTTGRRCGRCSKPATRSPTTAICTPARTR